MPWIFVYGTLMRGMTNHYIIKDYILQCLNATTTGRLYHLSEGYPMLLPDEKEIICGEAMKIYKTSSILGALDELEGFLSPGNPDNFYERIERDIQLPDLAWKVRAIVYVCPAHKIREISQKGKLVKGGDWKKFLQSRNKTKK